jgi:ubiquinone/menaquinone biosynthesis C-methylase UbiE
MDYQAKVNYQEQTVAHCYDQQRFWSVKGRLVNWLEKRLITLALIRGEILPTAKILDIPCGTGRLSIALSHLGYQVSGLDISPAMLQEAISKTSDTLMIPFTQGDAEALPFADKSFDAVVSLRFLGHTPPLVRERVLGEFNRISTGKMVLAYYLKNCLQGFRKAGRRQGMWFPVTKSDIEAELGAHALYPKEYFPLLPLSSETIVVLVAPKR